MASLTIQHSAQFWAGLAMAGVGALILVSMIIGVALGLGVLMFRVCSGRAQFARNSRRRPAHRLAPYHPNGEVSSAASLLTHPVLSEHTEPIEAVRDDD